MGTQSQAILAALLLVAMPACTTYDDVDLRPYLEEQGFALTVGPAPDGAIPVGLIAAQNDGYYLFGFIPFVRLSPRKCVDAMVESALKVEADGVAEILMLYKPASVLSIASFGLPDWFSTISMTGMAYRLPDEGSEGN